MAKTVNVAKASEFNEGTLKRISIQGKELLIARVGDKYYAVDNQCPHMGGDLSQGTLEGTVITCPRHGSKFDLSNGNNVRWLKGSGFTANLGKLLKSPRSLTTYRVQIIDADIAVEL